MIAPLARPAPIRCAVHNRTDDGMDALQRKGGAREPLDAIGFAGSMTTEPAAISNDGTTP